MPATVTVARRAARTTATEGPATLSEIFSESVDKNAATPALQWKQEGKWQGITYEELGQRVTDFAHALLSLGMDAGDKMAIYSRNCPQWAVADWAAVAHGFVTVPIYDTLTAEKAAYILKDSGARVVVVQTKEQLNRIRTARKQLPALRHVIVIEEIFEKFLEPGEVLFDQMYKQGQAYAAKHRGEVERLRASVKPDDLASIVYTSGTTGEPKGALLTQHNFASNVLAGLEKVPIEAGLTSLSFLPLSHVFERLGGHFLLVRAGCTIAYAESVEKVPDNLAEVKPHILFSVPRLYEKIYARIQEKVRGDSFLKRYIFRKAIDVGRRYVEERYKLKVLNPATQRKWKRFDRLVYGKIRERTGGRIKYIVSGGAPLSPEIHTFFAAVGLPVLQGYGLTETSPVISVNSFDDFRIGSAGKPVRGADVRIGGDGEILVKGPMVFQGYHKKAAETKEVFTADGYFKTGDIGRLDEDGFLFITDRKKELIVMSNGKKVAPQPIENELKTKPGIALAVVLGNNRQYISLLVSPDLEALKKFAESHGIKYADLKELVAHPQVVALVQRHVDEVNQSLSRYEQIKKFRILPSELTQESGELTPTLKVKRRIVDEKFKPLIEDLYRDGKEG